MEKKPLSPKQAQVLEILQKFDGNQTRAAEALGIQRQTFRTHLGRIESKGWEIPPHSKSPFDQNRVDQAGKPPTAEELKQSYEFTQSDNDEAQAHIKTIRPISEAEMYEIFQIDTEKWETESFVCKLYPVSCADRRSNLTFDAGRITGRVVNSGKMNITDVYNVTLKLKRRQKDRTKEYVEDLQAMLDKMTFKKWSFAAIRKGQKYVGQIDMPDIHADAREWGSPEQAMAMAFKCVRWKVDQFGHMCATIVLPVGHDLSNVDNMHEQTTKGTPQFNSCSPKFAAMAIEAGLIEIITWLSHRFYVDVPVVPGNHDNLMAFMLGMALKRAFQNNDRVNIDVRPESDRTYRKFFNVGVCYCHGDKELPKALSGMFAKEAHEIFSEARYLRVDSGHIHQHTVKPMGGVVWRHLPTLKPAAKYAQERYSPVERCSRSIIYTPYGPAHEHVFYPDEHL